ncbi:MAG: alpha/beta hydrolase family protein [Microthrixaceae bacterium]
MDTDALEPPATSTAEEADTATGPEIDAAAEALAEPAWWTPLGMLVRGTSAMRTAEKHLARQPLARLTTAGPRTARWATETMRKSMTEDDPGTPYIRLTPSLVAQVAMDESLMALAVGPNSFPSRSDYERVGAELALAQERLAAGGFLENPRTFHVEPPPLNHPAASDGWAMGRAYERIWWPSGYEPAVDLPGWDRWSGFESNRTASAWVLRHDDRPRPWLVVIHGFGMGTPFIDQMAFRVKHLHEELGINIAGVTLPAHGSRRPSPLSGEQFLNFDLMHAVHGLAQAVWDIRRLLTWVRQQDATRLGVMGVSLGGYMTAMTAAFERDLDLVLAGIPVIDFVDMFKHHSPRHVHMRAIEHNVLDGTATTVLSVVTPESLGVATKQSARAIYAGMGDRLAPPEQARRLWEHWDHPEICWYPGNHVGFMWAEKAQRFTDERLEDRGFIGS